MTAAREQALDAPSSAAREVRPPPLTFVVHAPDFSDTSGGSIVLHLLAHRLTLAGQKALLWPQQKPPFRFPNSLGQLWWKVSYAVTRADRRFRRGPFDSCLAARSDLVDAIVVYPEIVDGNPLGGRHVVRWLLHRPAHHTGQAIYGADDLFFFFMRAFDDAGYNRDPENELYVTWTHPAYRDEGRTDRKGSCYLIRKGAGREAVHNLNGSVRIDELSHEEKNAVFNRTELFYCYDPYTRYAVYAAIAGCVPVIVPAPGVSIDSWMADERDRYGLAYGEENIAWAVETRPLLLQRLAEDRAKEDRMVDSFISKCRRRFFPDPDA